MTEDEKLAAVAAGVAATLHALVDALTARHPGLSVALEERLIEQIERLQGVGDEGSQFAATTPRALLTLLRVGQREQRKR